MRISPWHLRLTAAMAELVEDWVAVCRHARIGLHRILVHVIGETDRHAGHADIVRELIDGTAGLHEGNDNMPPGDQNWWENHRNRLERAAQEAAQD